MSKPTNLILSLVLLISVLFSQNLDAGLKTEAIHELVSPIISVDTITTYDNFISSDGNEYVVLTIDHTPSFLVVISKDGAGYTAQFVRDEKKIENILQTRYSQIIDQKQDVSQINQNIKQNIVEFNSSRFLHEAKYDLLFGINNSRCDTTEQCRKACESTEVCDYVLRTQGDRILTDILKYQNIKEEIDLLVQKVFDQQAIEDKSEIELLTYYLDVIQKIKEQSQKMQNSEFVKQSYILYAGQIVYDGSVVDSAYEQAQTAIEPARASDQKNREIQSIIEITQLRVPNKEPEQENETQVELVEEEQKSPVEQQNKTTQYADAYPPISQDLSQKDWISLDNIVFLLSFLVVVTTLVYLGYITKKYITKEGRFSKPIFGEKKGYRAKGIGRVKGKEIENLEDLL